MKNIRFFLFLFVLLASPYCQAQKSSLLWSTYFGGDSTTFYADIITDSTGDIYVSGWTYTAVGFATKGAYQTSNGGNGNAFLAKFSPSGSLLWATYYGGNGFTTADGDLVIDRSGNIWMAGTTFSSSGIATSGAYQTVGNSMNGDVFLAKFSPSGNLLYGTYYGGYNVNNAYGLAIDTSNNLYITGYTYSSTGIATSGAYLTSGDSVNGGAFLAKFSPSGSLVWGTYYGDSGKNVGNQLITDKAGNIYLNGSTSTGYGIATSGAYQTSYGGNGDAYLAKFSSSGSLLWATLFGGSNTEGAAGIAIDKSGNIYLDGATNSTSGIATSGAYQTYFAGGGPNGDAFLAKFSPSGSLLWATYYGGSNDDGGSSSMVFDNFDNVWITGASESISNIATSGAYQTSNAGGYDAFIAKFNPAGSLLWATYYGGMLDDYGGALAMDASDNLYIAGLTISTSGLATSGTYQTSINSGMYETFIAKFGFKIYHNDAGIPYVVDPRRNFCSDTQAVKIPLTNYGINTLKSVKIGWEINGVDQTSINWTGSLKTDSATNITLGNYYFSPGTYNIIAWTSSPNGTIDSFPANDTVKITDTVSAFPKAYTGINKSVCTGNSTSTGGSGVIGNTYSWTSRPAGYSSDSATIKVNPTTTTTYFLTETTPGGGCSNSDSVIITVNQLPKVNAGKDTTICKGNSANLGAIAVNEIAYSWVSNPSGFTSTSANPSVTPKTSTTYILTETIKATGCKKSDTVTVKVNPLPDALFTYKLSGDTVKFTPANSGYATYFWLFGDGDTSGMISPSHSYTNNGTYNVSLEVMDKNGCPATYKTTDTINYTGISLTAGQISTVNIYPNPFTNQTTITGALDGNNNVSISIYDMTGRVIVEKNGERGAGGWFEYTFDASQYGSGIYIVKLTIGNKVVTREIVRIGVGF